MSQKQRGRKLAQSKSRPKKTAKIPAIKPATDHEYPSSDWPRPLEPKHAAFVDHYLMTFNGTQSAIAAGYTKNPKPAGVQAVRLLANDRVRAEIKRRRYAESERLGKITRERFEREVACGAFANMADYGPMFSDGSVADKLALLTREQAAAVQEITVEEFRDGRTAARQVRRTKLKLVPKVSSQELLARANGWLIEKVDHKHDHQHLILAVMLKEIAAAKEGMPIVEDAMQDLPDQRPEGEAA